MVPLMPHCVQCTKKVGTRWVSLRRPSTERHSRAISRAISREYHFRCFRLGQARAVRLCQDPAETGEAQRKPREAKWEPREAEREPRRSRWSDRSSASRLGRDRAIPPRTYSLPDATDPCPASSTASGGRWSAPVRDD
jgi:hypothetical protein